MWRLKIGLIFREERNVDTWEVCVNKEGRSLKMLLLGRRFAVQDSGQRGTRDTAQLYRRAMAPLFFLL